MQNLSKNQIGSKVKAQDTYGFEIAEMTGTVKEVFDNGEGIIESDSDGLHYSTLQEGKKITKLTIN